MKIAYQGVKGAYGYIASVQCFGDSAQIESCTSFQSVFDRVIDGKANFGVIPLENSTAGRVADVHLLLKNKPLFIVGEYFLPIRHCLMAPKGAKSEGLKNVYSHPQALMQCENNIHQMGIKRNATADTAGAAQFVAGLNDPTCAALASKDAAAIYDLEILQEDFQDYPRNATRFVIVSATKDVPKPLDDQGYISSFIFDINNQPLALAKCLSAFGEQGINLLKLESYTDPSDFSLASFYVDVEGHVAAENVEAALRTLKKHTKDLKFFGCYKAADFRKSL